MGLGPLSLWSLVFLRQQLVLVAGTGLRALSSAVVARISFFRRLWLPLLFGFGSHWMVPRRAVTLLSVYGRGFNHVNVVNITDINNCRGRGEYVSPLAVRGRQPYYPTQMSR